MPSFKTHSIHGESLLPIMDNQVEISKEDLKSFCIGPDSIILTDYKTFNYQHSNKTKQYFYTLIDTIKEKRLLDNSEVMAFLYGQLDHFALDSIMHPLIYYMTENIKSKFKIIPHGLIESWIDDYTTKINKKEESMYYKKWFIKNSELKNLINEVYSKVYGVKKEAFKYNFGMFATIMFDILAKRNKIGITPLVIKTFNLGDFMYKKNYNRALPFLNLEKKVWLNPETGEKYEDSFDDLWTKSSNVALDMIDDVNGYLYQGKELKNELILNDISWNTGLPCEKGQTLKYTKKY